MKYKTFLSSAVLILALNLSGCATLNGANVSIPAAMAQTSDTPIDWKAILPPPPTMQSPVQIGDASVVMGYQTNKDEARTKQAREDDNINPFTAYGSIIGADFNGKNYPATKALFDYTITWGGLQIHHAKQAYARNRPFQDDANIKICIDKPPGGSSYPSGHSALGWASANILARLYPAKSNGIYARGLEFGQSRVVCGLHYPTDVAMGRVSGEIILNKLQNDAQFIALFQKAREEILQKGNLPH